MNMNYFVYIVKCSDESLYTGITTDVHRRIKEHNGLSGKSDAGAKYTRTRRPVNLVYSTECTDRSCASVIEYRIKGLTRKQKQDLINGQLDLVKYI